MIYINLGMAIILTNLIPLGNYATILLREGFGINLLPINQNFIRFSDIFLIIITIFIFFVILLLLNNKIAIIKNIHRDNHENKLLKSGIFIFVLNLIIHAYSIFGFGFGWWDLVIMFYAPMIFMPPAYILILSGIAKELVSISEKT